MVEDIRKIRQQARMFNGEGAYVGIGVMSWGDLIYHAECAIIQDQERIDRDYLALIPHREKCNVCGLGLKYEPSQDDT